MHSVLSSLPSPKNLPLTVEVVRATPKKRSVAEDIAKVAQKILSQLKYKGRWTIALKKQLNDKTNFVFKLVNRHNNSIICRFKPGDNSTCWDVYLTPPAGYLIDEIYTNLRQVPSNGILIHLPEARIAKSMAVGVGKSKPKLPEPPKAIESTQPPVEPPKIEPPKAEQPPVEPPNEKYPNYVDWKQMQSPGNPTSVEIYLKWLASNVNRTNTKITIVSPDEEKIEPPMNEFVPLFRIQPSPSDPKSLLDDDKKLNAGLVAICTGIDPDNHDILRQFAVQIIVQELDIENYVKENKNYNSASKAAGMIIRGLVNKGWLSRWMATQRKKTTVRDTTKGYMLTRTGKEQLESVLGKLSNHQNIKQVRERIFHPELVVIQNSIKEVDADIDDLDELYDRFDAATTAPSSSSPSPALAISVEELVPLAKEFEARKKAIEECDVLIQDCLDSEKEIDNSFDALKNQLLRLKFEQSELETQLGSLKGQRDKINNDLQYARSLREEESKVLNAIKSKLGSAIN